MSLYLYTRCCFDSRFSFSSRTSLCVCFQHKCLQIIITCIVIIMSIYTHCFDCRSSIVLITGLNCQRVLLYSCRLGKQKARCERGDLKWDNPLFTVPAPVMFAFFFKLPVLTQFYKHVFISQMIPSHCPLDLCNKWVSVALCTATPPMCLQSFIVFDC